MSPHVGNFVADLVEMAKATEELPGVRQELAAVRAELEAARSTIADREASILSLKSEIEAKSAAIHSAEVARDDTELRFLEIDDRMLKLEQSFQTALEAMDATDKLIQSYKPVPNPEPQPEAKPIPVEEAPYYSAPLGQSASDPTSAHTPDSSPTTQECNGTVQTVERSSTDPQPYAGLRYHDYPSYVSYSNWIAGGGTDADYHWRPEAKSNW